MDGAGRVVLKDLWVRGERNGLRGLRWLSAGELKEIEPNAAGVAALHVPEEGIVDFTEVSAAMRRNLGAAGAEIVTSARVGAVRPDGRGWRLETAAGDFGCDFLVNCAGLYCDRVAEAAGERRSTRIVPFRGEYHRLKPSARHLVRHLIYPVPDPVFPFLGVHFTRMIGGEVEAGPSAVLALAREGYARWKVNPGDLADALLFPGLWRFMGRHRAMAWEEIKGSFSRRLACEKMRKLVTALQESDLEPGEAGVRAQAMRPDGVLVQDFEFLERANALHVLNAPSPGATASLAIGDYVAGKARALAGGE